VYATDRGLSFWPPRPDRPNLAIGPVFYPVEWVSPAAIVFESTGGLEVIAPDGSGLRMLAQDAVRATVSPDARQVAYFVSGQRGLWVTSVDGSRRREIVPDLKERPLAWSPDSRNVIYQPTPSAVAATSVAIDGSGFEPDPVGPDTGGWNWPERVLPAWQPSR
jgi:hypothetical protein